MSQIVNLHPVAPPTTACGVCADTGSPSPQPVSASLLNDPAVQSAFHDLSLSFKRFDKCIDDLVRIAEHKTVGRVPNFRFSEDEPAVQALEPVGTVVDRVMADVLRNMTKREAYQPSLPWECNAAGEIIDARGVKLGRMESPKAAWHMVRSVNGGVK